MGFQYKFHNPEGAYFVSFAVVKWMKLFNKKEYTQILLDSLTYCQQKKGMEIYAWCIMPDHVHLAYRAIADFKPEEILRDFKRVTSKRVVRAIIQNPEEKRRDYLLKIFEKAGLQCSNVNKYQFWQHDNRPIEIWSQKFVSQKIRYIHNNPVKAGLVSFPEDYEYSSAIDYTGKDGLIKDVVVVGI